MSYLSLPITSETTPLISQILQTSHLFVLRYAEEFKLLPAYTLQTQLLLSALSKDEEYDQLFCSGAEFLTGVCALQRENIFAPQQLETLFTTVILTSLEMRGKHYYDLVVFIFKSRTLKILKTVLILTC